MRINIHTYVYTCIHTYMHIHIHMYLSLCVSLSFLLSLSLPPSIPPSSFSLLPSLTLSLPRACAFSFATPMQEVCRPPAPPPPPPPSHLCNTRSRSLSATHVQQVSVSCERHIYPPLYFASHVASYQCKPTRKEGMRSSKTRDLRHL